MLREGRDILDLTLAFGHEDKQGARKYRLMKRRFGEVVFRGRSREEHGNRTREFEWDYKKMLRDSQDISDVTLVCGKEDGWRDK